MCEAMAQNVLNELYKAHGLYRTPALNDKLYCNFKGFGRIENLKEYPNIKALFLEGNCFETLEDLSPLKSFKC